MPYKKLIGQRPTFYSAAEENSCLPQPLLKQLISKEVMSISACLTAADIQRSYEYYCLSHLGKLLPPQTSVQICIGMQLIPKEGRCILRKIVIIRAQIEEGTNCFLPEEKDP